MIIYIALGVYFGLPWLLIAILGWLYFKKKIRENKSDDFDNSCCGLLKLVPWYIWVQLFCFPMILMCGLQATFFAMKFDDEAIRAQAEAKKIQNDNYKRGMNIGQGGVAFGKEKFDKKHCEVQEEKFEKHKVKDRDENIVDQKDVQIVDKDDFGYSEESGNNDNSVHMETHKNKFDNKLDESIEQSLKNNEAKTEIKKSKFEMFTSKLGKFSNSKKSYKSKTESNINDDAPNKKKQKFGGWMNDRFMKAVDCVFPNKSPQSEVDRVKKKDGPRDYNTYHHTIAKFG